MAIRQEAQSRLVEEFFDAVKELHDEGNEKPYLSEIRQQILADRAAEAGVIGRAIHRVGFRLSESKLEMARVSLEERGRLESTMEAWIDDQPPQLLVYLPEGTPVVESA